MNLPYSFLHEPEFLRLQCAIGPLAARVIISLGSSLQARRSLSLLIEDDHDLLSFCGVCHEVDPALLRTSLIPRWLVPKEDKHYSMPYFEEHNKGLIAAWKNGDDRKARLAAKRDASPPEQPY